MAMARSSSGRVMSYNIQYARQAQIGIWKILSASNAAHWPGRE